MNETDITILKLSEAGRAALAKLAALDALCEQQTRTIALTSERAVKAEKDLAVARELLELRTAERDACRRNLDAARDDHDADAARMKEERDAATARAEKAEARANRWEAEAERTTGEVYEERIRDIADNVIGIQDPHAATVVLLDAIERRCSQERIGRLSAEKARDEVGIQLAAAQARLGLAERCAGYLRTAIADGVIIDARAIDALAALDTVPGDALERP